MYIILLTSEYFSLNRNATYKTNDPFESIFGDIAEFCCTHNYCYYIIVFEFTFLIYLYLHFIINGIIIDKLLRFLN